MIKQAANIDEVISILQEIIGHETRLNSPLAYFPALYRLVTIRVKEGIRNNEFENGTRMEALDVMFANRYIIAYNAFRNSKSHSGSWRIAFESEKRPLLILQHLLLGMNVHISFDLGITSAAIMKGTPMAGLQTDFNTINRLLSEMTDKVQSRIGKVSPLIGFLDRLAGKSDAMIVKFSITLARDGAWKSACEFHTVEKIDNLLTERDKKISALGLALIYPNGRWIKTLISIIRLAERKNVKTVVDTITALS